jgi:hypothetical protein
MWNVSKTVSEIIRITQFVHDIFHKIFETRFCFKAVIFVSDLREMELIEGQK